MEGDRHFFFSVAHASQCPGPSVPNQRCLTRQGHDTWVGVACRITGLVLSPATPCAKAAWRLDFGAPPSFGVGSGG